MSTTKHTSFIPMSPELLPRQKLNEVVRVPELPKGLAPKVDLDKPLQFNRPKASPRKITFLCSVEWAWSPMHNRIDNLYLSLSHFGFLPKNNRVEDGSFHWTCHRDLIAYGTRCLSDVKTIAFHLIFEL